MQIRTVKVQPWGEGQGDFVEVNESDFDPKRHKLMPGERLSVPVDPLDHDHDGRKGGSMPDKPAPQAEAEGEPAGEPAAKPKRKVGK